MDYYPIFLDLRYRTCLVLGGGENAARKAEGLLKAGAEVVLMTPALEPPTEALLAAHPDRVHHRAKAYTPGDEEGAALVLSACEDDAIDRAVHAACTARGIPVNVVDRPAFCSYITPALVDRSPLLVAISSGGAAPVLARQIRSRLETMLPATYGRLVALAGRLRDRVQQALPAFDQRLRFWERVFDGPAAEAVLSGREAEGEERMVRILEEEAAQQNPMGEVFLVGAGPGDPDLLTFRALRLMQRADVVLYDRLVAPALVDLARKDAERIPVGKAKNHHTVPQEEINRRLADLAASGKRVLRLKGGDPFIFGRGGEELEGLLERGIPFQVVPGVTAAQGCAAYAGIPLTHRDCAQSCRFLTGHRRDGRLDITEWGPFHEDETLVFYMGLSNLPEICRQLLDAGMPADHPAAVVEQGTTPAQRVVTATLETLTDRVTEAALGGPALTIVSKTVRLAPSLTWFHGAEDAPPAFPNHGCLSAEVPARSG